MPGLEPSIRFSSTVSVGMRLRCWYTMPMPRSRPARGESMRTSRPSTRMVPLSGWYSPDRMLMSVDLPAPFSPSRHRTSPAHRREADAVVGDDAREGLGDAGQLDRGSGSVPAVGLPDVAGSVSAMTPASPARVDAAGVEHGDYCAGLGGYHVLAADFHVHSLPSAGPR